MRMRKPWLLTHGRIIGPITVAKMEIRVFTNPPLMIGESELREAFGTIDRGLAITDKAVE